ncbi:platelet endothelial cell adhesion molecule-like isoform X3 [Hyla sarda]|uniref:platelet endothelial cell adhesion molecule-like isoform X3 n=1 Tax=Hyla sarda TaxID=327740 RepID=UPI0024C45FA8|nr:platelet endothelial cell adhesion molecule-like isoform X3 [Hyla sarda]
MFLPIVVTLLGLWSVGGKTIDFTINSIKLKVLPSTNLRNGDKVELQCDVMIAKTSELQLNSTITFYMDDTKIFTTNSSTQDQASYTIPKARASHTGIYRCDVSVQNTTQVSEEVEIKVTGLSSPLISVSKNQTSEGDDVTVRCEAPEEWRMMTFTFYKIIQKGKEKEEKKSKGSTDNHMEVKFRIKEGEEILQFKCEVQLVVTSETSPPSKMQTVTVVAQFSTPRIEVSPSLNFTEGKNMSVLCSVQEAPKRSEDMKLTLQKDGQIIDSSTTNTLFYSRVATVEDMGNYTCKVESRKTSKSNSAKIVIIELFPRPHLKLQRTSSNQFIHEDESMTLSCLVDGLSQQTANNLEYKFLTTKRKITRRGGRFHMNAMESLSGSYVCQVTIANITKLSEPLDINIYAPVKSPVLTHIMRSNKTVILGDTLELTCRIQSGTPPITYSLLRGNHTLMQKTIHGDKEARFLVNSSKSHDLGQYRCQATNRNTKMSGKYSNIVNVTIIVPISRVNLTIIPDKGEVEEGAELSLICQVEDGTLPINYLFYRKKGEKMTLMNSTRAKTLSAQYQVGKFSKEDDGTYYCMADNGANKEVTSNYRDARAVLATWKKVVIGVFVSVIILAAITICAYLQMDKKKKGKDITPKKSRSSKPVTANNEKPAVEMKAGEAYYGNVKNEDELHILRTGEESPGNTQQNHQEEQTEANGDRADTPPGDHKNDAAENNVNVRCWHVREDHTPLARFGEDNGDFPWVQVTSEDVSGPWLHIVGRKDVTSSSDQSSSSCRTQSQI